MDASELLVGKTYRAKKPRPAAGYCAPLYNDREILWIDHDRGILQYDGPAIKFKARIPKVTIEKFLDWAGEDVTEKLKPGEWQEWGQKGVTAK